jgi:hypothetical protein
MAKEKRFNSGKFHELMNRKIKACGYRSVNQFIAVHQFGRNALARGLAGMTRPSLENLNAWCRALECTPEERAEIIASVYIDDEEIRQPAACA